jgi:prephenate dehydratase
MSRIVASKKIAFQGEPGANSHLAAKAVHPELEPLACATFEDAFQAVSEGRAHYGMIPIENSTAGRIADIHHLLPDSGLYIVGEHFEPIHHQLLGVKGATLNGIKSVMSMTPALGQCRKIIRELGLAAVTGPDTAASARAVAEKGDPTVAAIASRLAAEIYGLQILKEDVEDEHHNTTRFVVMAKEAEEPKPAVPAVTSFIFRVRNVPAALYKALGGFATNGVNMTKLESYQLDGSFTATQFYAEVDGRPQDGPVRLAIEELEFFSSMVRILGVYAASPFRLKKVQPSPADRR